MSETESEPRHYSCMEYDVVSWGFDQQQAAPAFQEHLQECFLCTEELEEFRSFFATDLVGEIAEEYAGVSLTEVSIPTSFLDRIFPKPLWERIFDELREQWAVLSRSPFATIAWESVRLKVEGNLTPGTRPRYYTGQQITLKLRIDEDCYVMILHVSEQDRPRLVSPKLGETAFLKLGTYEFTGFVEGRHDEVQRLIVLATKTDLQRIAPASKEVDLEWLQTLRQHVHTLPQEEWSWSEYNYRIVEPSQVSLEDLEESCLLEYDNKTDTDRSACGEVCRRMLDTTLSQQQRKQAANIFYEITKRLVYRWVDSQLEDIPLEQRQDVTEYMQEVYARFFSSPVKYQGYFQVLKYLQGITAHALVEHYRPLKRQIISQLRKKLNGSLFSHEVSDKAEQLVKCLKRHGLINSVDLVLLENLLKGSGSPELRTHPLLQEIFTRSRTQDLEKMILNRRDTAVWHAFKNMRKIQQNSHDFECRQVVESFI